MVKCLAILVAIIERLRRGRDLQPEDGHDRAALREYHWYSRESYAAWQRYGPDGPPNA